MNTLLLLIALSFGLDEPLWIRTPEHQYICTSKEVHFVEYKNWRVEDDGKRFYVDATIMTVSYETALQLFASGFLEKYNIDDFATLARHWRPETPPAPVTPAVEPPPSQTAVIYYVKSATSYTYHLPSCRYVNALMRQITAEEADKFEPCKVCKPNDFESIIKEFLPQ
jgi:hypothetical protein